MWVMCQGCVEMWGWGWCGHCGGARCGEVWRKGAGGGGKMRTMMPKTNAQEVCSIVVELPWRKLLCTLRCWHVKSVVSSQ